MKMVIVHYEKKSRGGRSRWECRPDLSDLSVEDYIDDEFFSIDDYVMVESKDSYLFAELLNYGCNRSLALEVIEDINIKLEEKGF